MSSAIELTVKALVEFEAQLDRAKAELLDAGKRASKDAADWAEAAKSAAIARAQEMASRNIAAAKEEAESEAEKIRKKGESDLRAFESSMAKHRAKASRLVASRLLGESP